MTYSANLPYPELKVMEPNINYAKMLLCVYAGMVSEETAVHQYIYQSFILEDDLRNILEKIAIVEMHHLEILAQLINLLGIDPKYYIYDNNDQEVFWSSKYVKYNKNIIELLKINIESETLAILNYEKLILAINDTYIIEIIKRIILDEQVHLQIFNNLLLEYEKK